ncbi:hypothetical protein IG631_00694 [Alternaria alternata]|nr:hypothetical protein IG631_00694 [Alternaria alternata]
MLKCIRLTKLDYFSDLSSEYHKSQYITSRNSNDNHPTLLDAQVEFTVMDPVRRLDAGIGPSGAPFHRRFSIVAVRNLLFLLSRRRCSVWCPCCEVRLSKETYVSIMG